MELDEHVKRDFKILLITLIMLVLITAIIEPEKLWFTLMLSLYAIVIVLLVGYVLIKYSNN